MGPGDILFRRAISKEVTSMKLGMKRLRDGSIGCVPYVQPERYGEELPVLLEVVGLWGEVDTHWAGLDGRQYASADHTHDIIEHLSDALHDPRTWQPAPKYKEGLWRCERGDVELFVGPSDRIERAWFGPSAGIVTDSYFTWDYICACPNPPVEHIGPNPLKGPSK
jgi:hypothetical protein